MSRRTRSFSTPGAEVHAHLFENDVLVGGGAFHLDEWVMTFKGQPISGTGSPAMLLAMLKRAASSLEERGSSVRLEYSTRLRDAATSEAEEEGKSLDELLEFLVAESLERTQEAHDGRPS